MCDFITSKVFPIVVCAETEIVGDGMRFGVGKVDFDDESLSVAMAVLKIYFTEERQRLDIL